MLDLNCAMRDMFTEVVILDSNMFSSRVHARFKGQVKGTIVVFINNGVGGGSAKCEVPRLRDFLNQLLKRQ